MDIVFFPLVLLLLQSVIGQPLQEGTEVDVDGGKDKDIFDINQELGLNLFEGDIKLQPNERNSIIGDQHRWPIPVPYYLEDSLEINAKALVLEAFERYRLKTCIDFKPWEGEPNYISVFKESGCWSFIGNLRRGKQQLSLGNNCDRLATIQHEFLHALGFWHEQSRSDRDDYVIIMWDRILTGREGNFNKYNDTRSSSLNVPYDYTSVMHYSKTAFQNGSEPTIVTRIEAFSDVIGQRMDFSDNDLEKLNRLYNCSTFISFLDTCDFEYNNICGMIQGTGDNDDWQHVLQVPYGPSTDHTNMGDCKDSGHFMHFNRGTLNTGGKAMLESRLFYPKRGFQCLEFFYYHNGHESDKLNIWIREYTEASSNGTLRFITTVNGQPAEYWQLYYVSLSTNNKFRVVFEGEKGNGNSAGGISIDDINLSEANCPHHIWHIRNFTNQLNSENKELFSPPYYSKDGYAFQVKLKANSSQDKLYDLGVYFHLISGENDNTLQWPCSLRQATMTLMDQNSDIRKRMSNLRSITTDPYHMTNATHFYWDKPGIVGTPVTFPNGTQYFRGPGLGTSAYITHGRVQSRDFLKGGDAFMLLSVDDVTYLNTTQPIPPTTPQPITSMTTLGTEMSTSGIRTTITTTTTTTKTTTVETGKMTTTMETGKTTTTMETGKTTTTMETGKTTTTMETGKTTTTMETGKTTTTMETGKTTTTMETGKTTTMETGKTTTMETGKTTTMETGKRTTMETGKTSSTAGPSPTTQPPQSPCVDYTCENDGSCAVDSNIPVCRCKVTKDWWYVGDRCETKVSSQETLVVAVSSSVTIFAVMLIITFVTVYCLKKKHKQQMKAIPYEMLESKTTF